MAINTKNICLKLLIVAGIIAILIISSNPRAFAKTVNVKGSGQGTASHGQFQFRRSRACALDYFYWQRQHRRNVQRP
jgi:hypothetical protein